MTAQSRIKRCVGFVARVWAVSSGALALRSALAAVAAWLVALTLGGVADDYPYYAPLGAVAAVSASVWGSIAAAVRTVLAITLGAGVGIVLGGATWPTPVGIGIVVVVGTVIGAWPRFGSQGSWVSVSALFTLVLGARDPWHFGFGYVALFGLGSFVGIVVSLILPPLRLGETRRAQDTLRKGLVEQLDRLAGAMEEDQPPTPQQWRGERVDTESHARAVRSLVPEVLERARVNWREQRNKKRAAQLSTQGQVLSNLALHVGDLADFLSEHEHAQRDTVPLGPELRPWAVNAFRDTARALETVDGDTIDATRVRTANQSVEQLAAAVRDCRERTGQDLFAAGALVTALRRQLAMVDVRLAMLGNETDDDASTEEGPASKPTTRHEPGT